MASIATHTGEWSPSAPMLVAAFPEQTLAQAARNIRPCFQLKTRVFGAFGGHMTSLGLLLSVLSGTAAHARDNLTNLFNARAPLTCVDNDAHIHTWINLALIGQTPHFACPLNRDTKISDLEIFKGAGSQDHLSRTVAIQLIAGLMEQSKWDQRTPGSRKETLHIVTQFISEGAKEGYTLGGLAELVNLLYAPLYY